MDLYRVAAGVAFDPDAETPIASLAVGPSASYSCTYGDATRANLLTDGDFSVSPGPWTLETGWSIGSGVASKAAGNNNLIRQPAAIGAGKKGRLAYTITAFSAGSCVSRLTNGTNHYEGPARNATGTFIETTTVVAATTIFGIRGSATFVGSIDNVYLYEETAACAPQGTWDFYAVPINGSGIAGPTSGPITLTII